MKNEFVLVSVKPKNSQSQGQIFVVRREDISSFVEIKLSLDNVLLIDSIDTFVSSSEE
nr:MAG TPA: hypothetical protein [Microviridae sp.]